MLLHLCFVHKNGHMISKSPSTTSIAGIGGLTTMHDEEGFIFEQKRNYATKQWHAMKMRKEHVLNSACSRHEIRDRNMVISLQDTASQFQAKFL